MRPPACTFAGVTFLTGAADSVSHGQGRSTLKLADGRTINASMVVDSTGHVRKLVSGQGAEVDYACAQIQPH